MAVPTSPRSRTSPSVIERYNHLESQVAGVAATLDGFIKEAEVTRARNDREQTAMWTAIREQGDNLGKAVEKLSSKGISWPMIVTTIGMILSMSAAASTVGYMLMESRIKQVEIRNDFMLDMCKENHESWRTHALRQ